MSDADIAREVSELRRRLSDTLHCPAESPSVDFLISSLTEYNPFAGTAEVLSWLDDLRRKGGFDVEQIPLAELRGWRVDRETGDLEHESGGFFSIRGLEVDTNVGAVPHWTQPIIDQPEIGVLGIVTQRINGILYLLLQAKAEPGNVNTYQLSPTVQATRSNYRRMHGGKSTPFLDCFLQDAGVQVLLDQLQSEQGARFYRKRNRNIIVRLPDDQPLDVGPAFRWVTLGQLKRLALTDNTVNMDTRSVVSCIDFDPERKNSLAPVSSEELNDAVRDWPLGARPLTGFDLQLLLSAHGNAASHCTEGEALRRIAQEKFLCELNVRQIPLNRVQGWEIGAEEIRHAGGRYFSVIGVRVRAQDREVDGWDQPIVKQVDRGIIGFVAREIGGVLHFLVQLKMECGNMDILELAPTVQCITDSHLKASPPPLLDDVLGPHRGRVLCDTWQSEEGGRFYQEENRNIVVLADDRFPIDQPAQFLWLTVWQLKKLLRFNNYLNVEARSLLSIL